MERKDKEENVIDITYKVKMYNEYEFSQGNVVLTDCKNNIIEGKTNLLSVENALSSSGDVGQFTLGSDYKEDYVCLTLSSASLRVMPATCTLPIAGTSINPSESIVYPETCPFPDAPPNF
jgi:hypothetical protein